MSEIHVSCNDQVLKLTQSPILASGGVNETKVVFAFCEKWNGFVKTAIFYRDTEKVYYAVLDENDTCILPWEVYAEDGTFFLSVFGEKDNTRRTASVVRYKVGKGVVVEETFPSDPTPEVYDQIMSLLNENREITQGLVESSSASIEAATKAAENANAVAQDLIEKRDSGYFDGKSIDDTKCGDYAWSSKNTVDKLCPTFTESGAVVNCEPVEGYPLEVEWQRKNLYNHDVDYGYISGANTSSNFTVTKTATGYSLTGAASSSYWILIPICSLAELSGRLVAVSANTLGNPAPIALVVCAPDYSNRTVLNIYNGRFSVPQASNYPDGYIVTLRLRGDNNNDSTAVVTYDNIQVEIGETATAYEPYAETATITRCGKNLFGGDALADAMVTFGATKNEENRTVSFTPPQLSNHSAWLFCKFKKNTQYTIILKGSSAHANGLLNMVIRYTDASYERLSFDVNGYCRLVTNPNKQVNSLSFMYWDTPINTLVYDHCGIFEGNISLEEFEAYNGGTFAPGEPITALDGVNTLYADAGLVTVTGKANPSTIIEKLTNAIIALGGNV